MSFLSKIGALFSGPKLSQDDISLGEQKTAIIDSLAPRTVCYGDGAWQASLIWRQSHKWGVDDLEPKEALTDVMVIGDHQFDRDPTRLWVDDERQTVGTDTGASGDFWVPAGLDNATGPDDYPTALSDGIWYVPNRNLAETDQDWQRVRNAGNTRIPVLTWKFWDGSQTTQLQNDSWLSIVPGWDDVARKGQGMAIIAMTTTFEVNTRVSPGNIMTIMPEGRGKELIYDWRTSTSSYTNNAALCFADALMWEYFPWQRVNSSWVNTRLTPASFNSAAMIAAADLCDETSGLFTGVRYNVNGFQIGADADPEKIFEDFSLAMGGMQVTLLDDEIVVIPGGPRTWVAGFDFSDLSAAAGIITPTRRSRRSRFNTIIPSYRRANAGWEFDEADPVTAAAYLSDDHGLRRTTAIKFHGIGGSAARERSERLAGIILARHRLEDAATISVHGLMGVDTGGGKGAAIRVREGDIVRLTYPRKGWTDKEFELVERTWNPATFTMDMELAEWATDIDWDGTGIVADEALTRGALWRGGIAPITGLTAAVVPGSSLQQTDGTVWVEVEVDWDDHPETIVSDGGTYRVRWKTAAMGKYASSVADTSRKRLTVENIQLDIEVRAEAFNISSKWVSISFTPNLIDLPAPVTDPTIGRSLMSNPSFDRSLRNFADTSADTGSISIINEQTDLDFPLGATQKVLRMETGSSINGKAGVSWDETVPVIPGDFLQCDVTLISRDIGFTYGAGNHVVSVIMAWKDQDDAAIDSVAGGGPIRDDEEEFATVGPVAFGAGRSDPGGHDIQITISNVIQVPRGAYGIRRLRVFCQTFNDGQEARWDCAQIKVRVTDTFPGRQRKSRTIVGGDQSKATRSSLYKTLVGMSNRAIYQGASGQDVLAIFVARMRVESNSQPTQGFYRFIRLLESKSSLPDPTTDPNTEIIDVIDDNEDDVLDDYELEAGAIIFAPPATNGPYLDVAFSAVIPMPALPDISPPVGTPTQSDRWIVRVQGMTDRTNGTIKVRNANLSLRQLGSEGVLRDV